MKTHLSTKAPGLAAVNTLLIRASCDQRGEVPETTVKACEGQPRVVWDGESLAVEATLKLRQRMLRN